MKLRTRVAYAVFPPSVWDTLRQEWPMTKLRWKNALFRPGVDSGRFCLNQLGYLFDGKNLHSVGISICFFVSVCQCGEKKLLDHPVRADRSDPGFWALNNG